ncbi:MAG: signal peptidase II [Clostridiaceae bacterium]|nr:signal peptidase II [Clostridiaceae bacterium]
MSSNIFFVMVFLIIIILDQVSKYIVNQTVDIGVTKSLLSNILYIHHTENKGMAFSIFENKGFIFMPLIIIIELLMGYYFFYYCDLSLKLPLDFILAGGATNLIDRSLKGSVTDFLQFRIRTFRSPIFNLADLFILVGAIVLLFN